MWKRLAVGGLIPVTLAASFGAGSAAPVPPEREYVLGVTGSDGTTFRASCEIETAAGVSTVEIESAVPVTRAFNGQGLSCKLTQTSAAGGITVTLQSPGGSRTRSSTQGEGSTVRLVVK